MLEHASEYPSPAAVKVVAKSNGVSGETLLSADPVRGRGRSGPWGDHEGVSPTVSSIGCVTRA